MAGQLPEPGDDTLPTTPDVDLPLTPVAALDHLAHAAGQTADPAAIAALGALLWRCLTGQTVPVPGAIPQLGGNTALAHAIDLVLRRSMTVDPDDRYPSVDDLIEDVHRAGRAARGQTPPPPAVPCPLPPTEPPAPATAPQATPLRSRRLVQVTFALVGATLLSLGGLVWSLDVASHPDGGDDPIHEITTLYPEAAELAGARGCRSVAMAGAAMPTWQCTASPGARCRNPKEPGIGVGDRACAQLFVQFPEPLAGPTCLRDSGEVSESGVWPAGGSDGIWWACRTATLAGDPACVDGCNERYLGYRGERFAYVTHSLDDPIESFQRFLTDYPGRTA